MGGVARRPAARTTQDPAELDAYIAALDSFYGLTESDEMQRVNDLWEERTARISESAKTQTEASKIAENSLDSYIAALDSFYVLDDEQEMDRVNELWKERTARIAEASDVLDEIGEDLKLVQTISETVSGRLEDGFTQAFSRMRQGITDFGDLATDVLGQILDEIVRIMIIAPAVKGLTSGVAGLFNHDGTGLGSGSTPISVTKVSDAVIKPDGTIISTHPDDYLIATKDPSSLGGGSGSVTVNIHNSGPEQKADVKQSFDIKGMVIDIWLTDYASNGPTRQAIGGAV